jgi:hypothetical protein
MYIKLIKLKLLEKKYMRKIPLIITLFSLIMFNSIYGQREAGAFYKIEKIPGELTKTVNLWGFVSLPGRYEIPVATNLVQLITYAGGPREYALMDEVKIYRLNVNGERIIIEVDMEDPEDMPTSKLLLMEEDIIVVDYSTILIWKDIFSTLAAPLAIVSYIVLIIDRLTNN